MKCLRSSYIDLACTCMCEFSSKGIVGTGDFRFLFESFLGSWEVLRGQIENWFSRVLLWMCESI